MKRVLTAVVLIPLVLLLVFKAHSALVLLAVGVVSYFCVGEFVEIAKGHGLRPFKTPLFGFVLLPYLVPLTLWLKSGSEPNLGAFPFVELLVCSPLAFLIPAMLRSNLSEALPDAAVSLLGFLYIGMGLFAVSFLHAWGGYSRILVLCLLVVVWSGDISAYYVGTYLGRRKLAPRVSPNKTWEGAIASFATATALGAAVLLNANLILDWLVRHHLLYSWEQWPIGAHAHFVCPLWFAFGVSGIINIAAQLGDLAESAMKRGASLKDSGAMIPGHGGMLDRVDALLFAAPVAMLLFAIGPLQLP